MNDIAQIIIASAGSIAVIGLGYMAFDYWKDHHYEKEDK